MTNIFAGGLYNSRNHPLLQIRYNLPSMLPRLHKLASVLLILLGAIHIGFTAFNFLKLTLDALWFASAGFAIIVVGFLNLALLQSASTDRLTRTLTIIANAGLTLLFLLAVPLIGQPQVYAGLALSLVALLATFFRRSAQR